MQNFGVLRAGHAAALGLGVLDVVQDLLGDALAGCKDGDARGIAHDELAADAALALLQRQTDLPAVKRVLRGKHDLRRNVFLCQHTGRTGAPEAAAQIGHGADEALDLALAVADGHIGQNVADVAEFDLDAVFVAQQIIDLDPGQAEPERAKEYPLTVTTGRRIPVYFHSEHRQLPWTRELWPVPRVEINPQTAEEYGIEQGDWVWIETEWGKIREVADLYYGVPKNVINCEHTWWYPELSQDAGHGFQLSAVNQLIDNSAQDPHCGSSNLRGYLAKIYKATPENSPFNNPVPCASDGTPIIHTSDDPRLKEWLPDYKKHEEA